MKLPCLNLVAALAMALAPIGSWAQASAPASTASGPLAAKPGPRLLTPEERRDSASPAGELRPERAVTPQINIPFGKAPALPGKAESPRARRTGPAPGNGGVEDAAARCEAQVSDTVRADCRARLARESAKRTPG